MLVTYLCEGEARAQHAGAMKFIITNKDWRTGGCFLVIAMVIIWWES